ncbi:Uncharacterised protein [Bordetella pertussis]|nr:Uncharacterised protein [Bordetella pertussis]
MGGCPPDEEPAGGCPGCCTRAGAPSLGRMLFRKSVSSSPLDRSSAATACPGGNSLK